MGVMALPEPAAGSTVVVTGASSGIGAALARELSKRGHHVTLVARRLDRLEALADELGEAEAVRCDVGDAAARGALLGRAGRQVVGLCNSAGFGSSGPFVDLDLEREAEMVRVNVEAVHHLTGLAVAEMVAGRNGAVLNVASIAGFQPLPSMATYAATKAFVISFSEALHTELHGSGVSVTSLCPGPVPTEFGRAAGLGETESRLPTVARVSPQTVARQAVDAMEGGKRSVIPGVHTKGLAALGRFAPHSVGLPLTWRVGRELR